ncbi:MAG: MBL fold metallo-hydrolase [Clostridia bacterium]|nr:MBL fold metallo-hydrolase [Clostridia bacterium]
MKTLTLLLTVCLVFLSVFTGCSFNDEYAGQLLNELISALYTSPDITFTDETDRNNTDIGNATPFTADGTLTMYMIDVGQGDSSLLISPAGKTMLIDSGEYDSYAAVSDLLDELNITSLDVVVATHPHSDHIGCMGKIIKNYDVASFYLTSASHTTKSYTYMLEALEASTDTEVYLAEADSNNPFIDWDSAVEVRILSPFSNVDYDLNNSSIMMRVKFGNNAIMFTGDAESYAERTALSRLSTSYFKADVLKVGHHGSSNSSCDEFLSAVDPDIALISLGADNDYGHPHREIVSALKKINAQTYRTDECGTICVVMDGNSIEVKTSK